MYGLTASGRSRFPVIGRLTKSWHGPFCAALAEESDHALSGQAHPEGDPSWAGPLGGVALGLPVYHVTEEAVKNQIPTEVYDDQVALMEMVLDVSEIAQALQEVRAITSQQA